MKRLLLTMLLFCAVLGVRAQVILNEFYTDPSGGSTPPRTEFFELFNTGTDPLGENLDCYTLVIYFKNGGGNTQRGFYVIDLPSFTLLPKKYFVGSSATAVVHQGGTAPANLNYSQAFANGSIRKFRRNTTGNGYTNVTSTELTNFTQFNNIFEPVQGNGGFAFFLFKGSSYVNGLLVGFNSGVNIPEEIAAMPNLTVPLTSNNAVCGTDFTINWRTNVLQGEIQNGGGSGGTDNGYARTFDGYCGTWFKVSNNNGTYTPGATNRVSGLSPTGFLQTTERYLCNNEIGFSVDQFTGVGNPLDITVEVYVDNGLVAGQVDESDFFLGTQTIKTIPSAVFTFPITNPLHQGRPIILVYKTGLGCIDKVRIATVPQFNLLPTATYCNGTINVSFPTTNPDNKFLFPLEIGVYPTINKQFGDTINENKQLTKLIVTELRSSVTIPLTSPTDEFALVFKPTLSCAPIITPLYLTSSESFLDLITEERVAYSNTVPLSSVQYRVTGITNTDYQQQVIPYSVKVFVDNPTPGQVVNGATSIVGQIDSTDVRISAIEYNNFMTNFFTVPIPESNQDWQVLIAYTKPSNCFNEIAKLQNVLPVKFSYFTTQRNPNNKKQVQLDWETSMEQNNKGFYIQRMTRGEWEDIGFVNTAAVDGNSNVPLKYHFEDVNLFSGTTFYRMYQVDFDGKADYSEVKSVDGQGLGKTRLVVYPNPALGGSTTVVFTNDTARNILLVDAKGGLVQQWRNYAGNRLTIHHLQPGFYTLKVLEGDSAVPVMEKIIVQ